MLLFDPLIIALGIIISPSYFLLAQDHSSSLSTVFVDWSHLVD